RAVPADRPVAVQRVEVLAVPVRGEHRGERRPGHRAPPSVGAGPVEPGDGAVQPRSRASFRPSREGPAACGPSPARPSENPASTREACFQPHTGPAPRVGSTSLPSRRSSTSLLALSGVWLSKNSQLTITTGAKSQAALHSRCSSVTLPSSVVSSLPTPRCSLSAAKISSPPITAHSVLVHTPTWYSPIGRRLYMV